MPLTPHQKIKRAALNGTGLTLTSEEVHRLYFGDDAIKMAADNDDGWAGKQRGTYAEQKRAASITNE